MAWVALGVAGLLLLSFVPWPGVISSFDPLAMIDARYRDAIETAIKSNAADLALFTEALAVLNVTSSTDVGIALIVRADVKIGDALAEARELLHHAQTITVAAAFVLQVLRIFTDMAALVGPVAYRLVLVTLLLALGAAAFFNRGAAHAVSLDVLRVVLLLFLAVKVLIPLTLFLSSALVSGLDLHRPISTDTTARDLAASAQAAAPDKDVVAHWGEGTNVKSGLNGIYETFKGKADALFGYVVGLLVFHIMHGIVFPLIVFGVIWKIARLTINHIFVPSIASINADRSTGTP